jgi:hypothetical protein
MGQVQRDRDIVGVGRRHVDQPVTPGLGAIRQDRPVRHGVEMACMKVELATQPLQQQNLVILHDFEHDAIDIGQLVAGRVDLPVVGVAFENHLRAGIGLHHCPAVQRGLVDVLKDRVAVPVGLFQKQFHPGFGTLGGHCGGQIGLGGVVGMEGLQIMCGPGHHLFPARTGQVFEKKAVRCRTGKDHLEIPLGSDRTIAFRGFQPAGDAFVDFFVLQDGGVPEGDIGGGEWRAVRPAHPFAEGEGIGRGVG